MYYMTYGEPYLEHHGVPGQKKGERHGPPYPLVRDAMGRLKTKMQEKRKAATAAKASQKSKSPEEKAAEEKARLKKDIREHPKKLYEHRDEFSKEEVEEIIKQIQWDRRISDVSKEEHTRNVNTLMNVVRNIGSFAESSNKVISMFNNLKNLSK